MPSNPAEDLLSGLDPIDAATMFAGLRSSVPLAMLFRSGELNAGEDAELARRRGPAPAPAPRARTYEDEQRDFEAMFPDPAIRRAVLTELIAQRTQPYHPATATRRKDYEMAPEDTRHEARPLMKKAEGGAVTADHTQPDMADGGQLLADPNLYAAGGAVQKFGGGGRAAKTLDEMMAEMAKKGVKLADKPDLSRRSLFGLGPKSAFPLANLDDKALQRMQSELKGAPAITEKSVTVDPGKGGVSETVKSIAATPMSRRSVLQSAAGQVLQGALPQGALPTALGAVEDVAQQAVKTAIPAVPLTMQGIIAKAAKMGLSEDDTIKMLLKHGIGEHDVQYMLPAMRNPYDFVDLGEEGMSRARALSNLIGSDLDKPMTMRGPLREIRRENPEMYRELKQTAEDIKEYGHEN